ncbi:MAG: DUF6122 family protein [Pseudomonadota bacterium]
MLHLMLHFAVPLGVAWLTRGKAWLYPFLWMMAGMAIDLDHLLADPIYDPLRCSIGFHPLHTMLPMLLYIALLIPARTRWLGAGLCIHILLDSADCYVNQGVWFVG